MNCIGNNEMFQIPYYIKRKLTPKST